jgi:hypothetical protein
MSESRAGILKAVAKPLQFLTLAMLVMEVTLGGLAWRLPDYRGVLVWAIIGFLLIFISIAIFIEVRNQQASVWLQPYAALFAEDLVLVLDGYSLTPSEKREMWASLADIMLNVDDPGAPRAYLQFREDVAKHLKKKLNLQKAVVKTQGPIDD